MSIWSDPWIPNGVTRRTCTPRGRVILNKVADLIDQATGKWDEELIRDVFWEEDVQHILSIPLKPGYEDTIAWHNDSKGRLSVKSAYHTLDDKREREKVKQSGSSSSGETAGDSNF